MSGAQRLATRLLLALSIAAGGFAVATAAASAATLTLYAAPAATGNESCGDAADACTLTSALGVAAGSTNAVTIRLGAGAYAPATISAGSETSLALVGSGGAVISTTTGAALTVNASGLTVTLEQLAIEGGSPDLQLTTATRLTIVDSALIAGAGDGLDAGGGALLIQDSTIAGNLGRGVDDTHATAAALYGSTIAHNQAGVIEAGASTPVDLGADLLAANGGADCSGAGTIADEGYDDSDDSTCPVGATSHNSDAQLSVAAPAANGGPTETARLDSTGDPDASVPTGVVIPGESAAFCSGSDQRGIARTQGPASSCDAGSYQYAPPVVTGVSPRSELELGLTATLSGYGFTNVTTASFGSAAAAITSESDSSLALSVPTSLALGSQPITVTNPDGSTQVPFDALAPPLIGTWLMTPGELKVAYSQPLPISGGAAPFSFTLLTGALPAGLALSSSGLVSGTPTKAGGARSQCRSPMPTASPRRR